MRADRGREAHARPAARRRGSFAAGEARGADQRNSRSPVHVHSLFVPDTHGDKRGREWTSHRNLFREPGAGREPVALHGLGRHIERGGGLLERQPREEPTLDHLRRARTGRRQTIEGLVERVHIVLIRVGEKTLNIGERKWRTPGPPLRALATARVIDQDPAHGLGSDRKEVMLILGRQSLPSGHQHIRLVHQSRRRERVALVFVPKLCPRERLELPIYERKDAIQRVGLAVPKAREPLRDRIVGHCGSGDRDAHNMALADWRGDMHPTTWERLDRVFFGALDVPNDRKSKYLDDACQGDVALRGEVEAMLRAHAASTGELADVAPPPNDDPTVGARIGAYRIAALIGRGGMGEVYRAVRDDSQYEQEVAIKLVRPGRSSVELMRRFRLERQILARLQHPSIATLLDGGVTDRGQPYLVMQYVAGTPITAYAESRRLTIAQRLRLFVAVCDAVQFAHANLVVHRDLKPSNILVTDEGQVRLLDFGIAKLLDGGDSGSETADILLLTPEHAAPEQFLGGSITTATDVYALGVLLYELVAGQRPFHSVPRLDLQRAVCTLDPALPSTLRAKVGDLDAIVMMALRKEPERRYTSAGQLRDDIVRYLANEPVIARPDAVVYRARKFVARNRVAVAAAATIAVLLVGATVSTAYQSRQRAIALAQAQSERANTHRVVEFLIGVFNANDPSETRGRTVTARELLDRAAEQIRFELADAPQARADMQLAIGRAYGALGLFSSARPHFEQALAQRRGSTPGRSIELADALDQMGRNRASEGRFEDGIKLGMEGVAIREAVQGPRHPDVAAALARVASMHIQKAREDTARALLERALDIQRSATPRDARAMAITLRQLGLVATNTDRKEEALARYREAVEVARASLGADHPFLFNLYEDLALGFEGVKQPDSAIAVHRSVLASRERVFGPDHIDVSYSLHNLGRVIGNQGRWTDALPLFKRGLEIRERALGKSHPAVGYLLHSYAIAVAQSGDIDGSIPMFQRDVEIMRTGLGPSQRNTLDALEALAQVTALRGRYEESLTALTGLVDGGYTNARLFDTPVFKKLGPDPRFQKLRARMRERSAPKT
jgi:eukaryotic-like serine/threonine-protein kinase